MKNIIFTCGDINGIGPEIVIKTICNIFNPEKYKLNFLCPKKVFIDTARLVGVTFPFEITKSIDVKNSEVVSIVSFADAHMEPGIPTRKSGETSYKALEAAFKAVWKEKADAIVTAPISKKAFQMAGIKFKGHTEILAKWSRVSNYMMMFHSKNLMCGLVTIHEPIDSISKLLTQKKLETAVKITVESLKTDFGIKEPKIAVLGLNPHAGEEGIIGKEEMKVIKPVLQDSEYKNYLDGPFVPDAFFANKLYKKYDFVLGMYHDQVLIPFKLMNFNTGVNFTAGLPIIRTSPDHGTAFDIAQMGVADSGSMIQAFHLADKIIDNRRNLSER